MSNENKTALTAEEINLKANEVCSNKDELYGYRIGYLEGRKDASLQTKEKDKEIEELKTSIEGVFGWREKNHHLTISEKQLKSQLSEVTKERDRIKGGYLKVLTMLNEILTPTKE